jgi:hypothetical protein
MSTLTNSKCQESVKDNLGFIIGYDGLDIYEGHQRCVWELNCTIWRTEGGWRLGQAESCETPILDQRTPNKTSDCQTDHKPDYTYFRVIKITDFECSTPRTGILGRDSLQSRSFRHSRCAQSTIAKAILP